MAAGKKGNIKDRARSAGAAVARGTKGTLLSGGTGVGVFYAGKSLSNNETLKAHPYYMPIGLVAAGHFVKKKQYDIGAALIGIGTFIGAQVHDAIAAQEKAKTDPASTAQQKLQDLATNPNGAPANGLLNAGDSGWTSMDVPMLRDTAGVLDRRENARRDAAGLVNERGDGDRRYRSFMSLSDS